MFFWNSLAFLMTQQMLAIWSLVPLPFLIPAWTPGPRRKEQWPHKRLCRTCLWVSRVSSRGVGQWWSAAGLGALTVAGHAWDLLREVTIIFIKVKLKSLSCVWLFANPCLPRLPGSYPGTQAPPSMGFPRQEYWGGLPFPSPVDLSDPRIKPGSSTLQSNSLPLSHQGSHWRREWQPTPVVLPRGFHGQRSGRQRVRHN